MKTKTYLKGCDWCNATSHMQMFYNPNNPSKGSTSAMTNICPVCKGAGTVIVTETEE